MTRTPQVNWHSGRELGRHKAYPLLSLGILHCATHLTLNTFARSNGSVLAVHLVDRSRYGDNLTVCHEWYCSPEFEFDQEETWKGSRGS